MGFFAGTECQCTEDEHDYKDEHDSQISEFGLKRSFERQRIGKYPQITQILFQILCAPSWPPNIREARA
jgi:hypothetical protein